MSATPRENRTDGDRGSRAQLIAVLAVTLFVMILGVAVVLFPRQLGVPQALPATPTIEADASPGAASVATPNR